MSVKVLLTDAILFGSTAPKAGLRRFLSHYIGKMHDDDRAVIRGTFVFGAGGFPGENSGKPFDFFRFGVVLIFPFALAAR
jgi:hypothetical protein